jgi:intracellular sulfur oxidation DsrE/DsrF family protein
MPIRPGITVFAVVFSMVAFADEPVTGPVIEDYGPVFTVEDKDVELQEGFHYKAVFDVAGYAAGHSSVNSEIESVARFLNMHARNGVPTENMTTAVVLHGNALVNALSNDAYRQRFQVDNPNLELMTKLHEAGVEFYACGQSMGFRDVHQEELASPVKVALSAMTMLISLQTEGYALLP